MEKPAESAHKPALPSRSPLLADISRTAATCAAVERQLAQHPAPGLETLIKLHRLALFNLSLEASTDPQSLKLIKDLMRPLIDWERLEEKRKDRQLAEQKYRDQIETQKAAHELQKGGDALRPETLARIERELNLI